MDVSVRDLQAREAQGMVAGATIAQYEIGSGRNFVYLILDPVTRRAAIVDPQRDLERVLSDLAREGFTLEKILLTHTHPDHTAGVEPLLQRFPGLEIWVGEADVHRLPAGVRNSPDLRFFADGGSVRVGGTEVVSHHTPGHTEGGHCLHLKALSPPVLLTGDLVFIGDCGRTDLPGGSDAEMFASLQRLRGFEGATVLGVGHHYARECWTRLDRELRESPPFQCRTVEELAKL